MKFLAAYLCIAASAFAAAPTTTVPSVTLGANGSVTISTNVTTNGFTTSVVFSYGLSAGTLDQTSSVTLSNQAAAQPANALLTGLIGGQTYKYQVTAKNRDGSSDAKPDPEGVFTVPPYVPTVTPQPAQVTRPKITLKANITSNGSDTTAIFEYGPTTAYGDSVNAVFAGGGSTLAAGALLTLASGEILEDGTLLRGQTYNFKVTATNGIGSKSSDNGTFVVLANQPPKAKEDVVLLKKRVATTYDVLSNDSDPDGDALTLVSVSHPKEGTAEVVDGKVVYTPNPKSKGPDSFTYIVKDNYASSPLTSTGTVTVRAPGLSAEGLHAAQIKDEDGNVTGLIRLVGTGNGTVTGKIQINSKTYTVKGKVDDEGRLYVTIPREEGDLQVAIRYGVGEQNALTADISSGSSKWTADTPLVALTPERREEINGRYTVQIPAAGGGTGTSSDLPQGTGFARMDVKPWGDVVLKGKLGDGTKFATRGVLGGDGDAAAVQFWMTPKDSRVSGQFNFGTGENPNITGEMKWFRNENDDAQFFPKGFFVDNITPTGGRYLPPDKGRRSLGDEADRATITLSSGNLSGSVTQQLDINKRDNARILGANNVGMTISFDRKNGTFRGEFDHPADGSRRKFQGVLLQQQKTGSGVFLGQNQTGSVRFTLGTNTTPTTQNP
jgi:hypothetical protein